MPRAVRFDRYGDIDVLNVVEVERPKPGPAQVLVQVKAAGINPGEAMIRKGMLHDRWPATFPSGQGSDLAGIVAELGAGVSEFAVGDEVIGFTEKRASQAEYVVVEAAHVVLRPPRVSWEQAGALFVVGTTAYAAIRAVSLRSGETLVVSGAAGGVGSIVVQLAVYMGARVIGLASPANHAWLAAHKVIPLEYGDGLAERIRATSDRKIDAFIDTFGARYIELALELGVAPQRIDTIINFADAKKYGTKAAGNSEAANADVLRELVALINQGVLEIPIARTFPWTRSGMRTRSSRSGTRGARSSCGPDFNALLGRPLEHRGDALAAADAHCLEAVACTAAIHFAQQRGQDASARRADRVAERNPRAMHVHAVEIGRREFPFSCAGDHLRRERFVQFDEVNVFQLKARATERLRRRRHRTDSHDAWRRHQRGDSRQAEADAPWRRSGSDGDGRQFERPERRGLGLHRHHARKRRPLRLEAARPPEELGRRGRGAHGSPWTSTGSPTARLRPTIEPRVPRSHVAVGGSAPTRNASRAARIHSPISSGSGVGSWCRARQ